MTNTIQQKLQHGIEQLNSEGLNLFAILKFNRLPEQVRSCFAAFDIPFSDESRIILIGHAGKTLWKCLQKVDMQGHDPIDQYSREAATRFAQNVLNKADYQIAYPGETPVALQQLGTIAGWHTPSPLGLGINPQWGLWYAYRAAILTNTPLPEVLFPTTCTPM